MDDYIRVTTFEEHFSDVSEEGFTYRVLRGDCKVKTLEERAIDGTYDRKAELYCKPGSVVEYRKYTYVMGEKPPYGKDYISEQRALVYVNSKDDIKEYFFVLQKEIDMSGEYIKRRKIPEVCKSGTYPDKYLAYFCRTISEEY